MGIPFERLGIRRLKVGLPEGATVDPIAVAKP